MKKILLCLLLAVTLVPVQAQEFLTNGNYIYGIGSHRHEAVADSLALLSFVRCVGVDVKNNITHEITDNGRIVTEFFKRNTQIISGLKVSGLKKYEERVRGKYTVYYYINKKEYVDSILREYKRNIIMASAYKAETASHSKNLALGSFYLAWKAINADLFKAVYPDFELLKSYVLTEIKDLYENMGYLLSARYIGANGEPSNRMLVRDENAKALPGFEYLSHNGVWTAPRGFLNEDCRVCTDREKVRWAYVDNTNREFHFLYETVTDNGIVKIEVPDEFYHPNGVRYFFF